MVCKQGGVANNAFGKTRRAADAIVRCEHLENAMGQSQVRYENLEDHPFVKASFSKAVEIAQKLQTGSITAVEAEYIREPDEYEFYVIQVGHTLAHLLHLCEQLVHAVLFLSSFTPTKRMREAGITRAGHLQYNIENYLIRTQSVHDRVLKLVNAVFHLGLRPQDCRHDTIAKNLHVKSTGVPVRLQAMRKLLGKYRQDRNIIIHHETYQEDDLRELEMYYLAQKLDGDLEGGIQGRFLYVARSLTREFVNQKMHEFDKFNGEIFRHLELLFDDLKPKYEAMTVSLRQKCGHETGPSGGE